MNELELKNGDMYYLDSREVAEMLEKSHADIIRYIEGRGKNIGIIPILTDANVATVDYFIESTYTDEKNEIRKCYLVSKKGCEVLGNKQRGEKGILFTIKYVERFNAMEDSLKAKETFKIPSTYKEALQQLLEQVETNEKLIEENNTLLLDNKCLSGEILQWADRSRINFGIRKLNTIAHIGYGKLWNELYQELKYKSHIDLKARGKQPYISHMKETEWHIILETFSALCTKYNTSPSKMLKENEVL